jgi:hypothetical protein
MKNSLFSKKVHFSGLFFAVIFIFTPFFHTLADQTILVKGKVGSVIEGPSAEDTSGTDSKKSKAKKATTSGASLSVEPANTQGAVFSQVAGITQFTTPRPAFRGTTNIQGATITLIFSFGEFTLKATLQAGADGTFSWVSPEDFPNGAFKMTVTAVHPTEVNITAETSTEFSVLSANSTNPWNQQYPEVPRGNLFDLSTSIQDQYTTIVPGSNIVASIQLINFTGTSDLINALVDYRILDDGGNEVLSQQETVVVGTKISYFKVFYTQPSIKPGLYTLVVKTPSQNGLALTTDDFRVEGKSELPLNSSAKIDYTAVFLLMVALFFAFIFLSYFEFIRFLGMKKRIRMVTAKFFKRFF